MLRYPILYGMFLIETPQIIIVSIRCLLNLSFLFVQPGRNENFMFASAGVVTQLCWLGLYLIPVDSLLLLAFFLFLSDVISHLYF